MINDVDHIQEEEQSSKRIDPLEDFIWQHELVTNEFSDITGRTQEGEI